MPETTDTQNVDRGTVRTEKKSKLSPKEQRFIEEYPVDWNATQAILRAGYSVKNERVASSYAQRLLAKGSIQVAIQERARALGNRADANVMKTLTEARRIAFSDPGEMFNPDGTLKAIKDMTPDVRASIASFEVEEVDGSVPTIRTKKVRLWDKNSALDKLCKYHKLYSELGSKDNPLHILHGRIDWSKFSDEQLALIERDPSIVLSTAS